MGLIALSTLVIVPGKNRENMGKIKNFSFVLIIISTAFAVFFNISWIKHYTLSDIYSLGNVSFSYASEAFFLIIFIPFITGCRLFFEGMLVRDKYSTPIGVNGIIRVLIIALVGVLLKTFYPIENGVMLGLILFVISEGLGAGYLLFAYMAGSIWPLRVLQRFWSG